MKGSRGKWRKRLLIAGLVVLTPFLLYYGLSAAYTGLSFVVEQVGNGEKWLFMTNVRVASFGVVPKHFRVIVSVDDMWPVNGSSVSGILVLYPSEAQALIEGELVRYGNRYLLLEKASQPRTETLEVIAWCDHGTYCKQTGTFQVFDAFIRTMDDIPMTSYLLTISEHLLVVITFSLVCLFLLERGKRSR